MSDEFFEAFVSGGQVHIGPATQGSAGQVLARVGLGFETEWLTVSSGGITSLNGLTGATQTFAVGTSGSDVAIVSSGSTHTFSLPNASASARGLLSTGSQIIAGNKQFNGEIIIGAGAPAGFPLAIHAAADLNLVLVAGGNGVGFFALNDAAGAAVKLQFVGVPILFNPGGGSGVAIGATAVADGTTSLTVGAYPAGVGVVLLGVSGSEHLLDFRDKASPTVSRWAHFLDGSYNLNYYSAGYRVVFTTTGNVLIGLNTQPSGGGAPVIVLKDAVSDPTGMPANSAGLYTKAGEGWMVDAAGNSSLQTPHPLDAPPTMYDDVPGREDFKADIQQYRGRRYWRNNSRLAKLALMTPAQRAALTAAQREYEREESFAQYNARIPGANLVKQNWDAHQQEQATRRAQEQAKWDSKKSQLDAEHTQWLEKMRHRKLLPRWKQGPVIPKPPSITTPRPETYQPQPAPAAIGA